jgi:hypothetical protein
VSGAGRCVSQGLGDFFVIGDPPFLSPGVDGGFREQRLATPYLSQWNVTE